MANRGAGAEIAVTGPSEHDRSAARGPRGCASPREGVEGDKPVGTAAGEAIDGQPRLKAVESGRAAESQRGRGKRGGRGDQPAYGALDLGTNNCRLLVAQPSRRGFFVIDSYSKIIRLGEGVTQSGRLSEVAMDRTLEALKICSDKMKHRRVNRSRVIATEACRIAENSSEFVARVREEAGLDLEVVSHETEAQLAVAGCASLIDHTCDWALVFDIGGGSSELIWLDLRGVKRDFQGSVHDRIDAQNFIAAWTSLRLGVVTLSEKHGGRDVSPADYEAMVEDVMVDLTEFESQYGLRERIDADRVHLLGTSGTVTTIAGIHLQLPYYDRKRVDGCWLQADDARAVSERLVAMSYAERVAQPCIGDERADLVLAGCAILEAMLRMWPCKRLRVADRGLREGILANLMAADGFPQWRRQSRKSRSDHRQNSAKR